MTTQFNGNLSERLSSLQMDLDCAPSTSPHVLEKTIVKECLKWAKSIPNSKWYKRHGGPGRRGEPDISGCVQGIRCEIEMKVPGNKPTDLQDFKIREWESCGAISFWTDSVDGFMHNLFNQLKQRGIELNPRLFKTKKKGVRACVAKKRKQSERWSMETSL
jgi:hypothetical protein